MELPPLCSGNISGKLFLKICNPGKSADFPGLFFHGWALRKVACSLEGKRFRMPSALLWASLAEILFWILQIRQGCGPAGFAFSRERALREAASAAVGLRPKRSKSNAFYGNAPHRGTGAQRLRGVPIGGSRKYGEKIFTPNRRESSVFSGGAYFFGV